MLLESKQLREDRAKAFTAARSIVELATKEGDNLTTEQEAEYAKHLEEYGDLDKQVKRVEKLNELNAEQKEVIEAKAAEVKTTTDEVVDTEKQYSDAFAKYLKTGISGLSNEEREIMSEKRAQAAGTDSAGGFMVPQEFSNELEVAMQAYGGIRSIARVINTASGGTLDWPTVDSTSLTGEWLAENVTSAEQDETFANVTLSAYTASSKHVKYSRQLMQDSAFDVNAHVAQALGERIGRVTATAYIAGSGSGQPTGVKDSATPFSAADDATISFDDMIGLKHDLDPAYRANATWVLNDSTLKSVSTLKDSDGQYLWRPSLIEGTPDLILGHNYVIDQDMQSIAAGTRSVLFGSFDKYIIRDVLGFDLIRMDERFADTFQVGYVAFMRTDGKLIQSSAVRALRHLNT